MRTQGICGSGLRVQGSAFCSGAQLCISSGSPICSATACIFGPSLNRCATAQKSRSRVRRDGTLPSAFPIRTHASVASAICRPKAFPLRGRWRKAPDEVVPRQRTAFHPATCSASGGPFLTPARRGKMNRPGHKNDSFSREPEQRKKRVRELNAVHVRAIIMRYLFNIYKK